MKQVNNENYLPSLSTPCWLITFAFEQRIQAIMSFKSKAKMAEFAAKTVPWSVLGHGIINYLFDYLEMVLSIEKGINMETLAELSDKEVERVSGGWFYYLAAFVTVAEAASEVYRGYSENRQ